MQSASNQSLMVANEDDDEDLAAYLSQLRDTIVDCYTSIVHGIRTNESKAQFVHQSPNIFNYLGILVSKPYHPTKVN